MRIRTTSPMIFLGITPDKTGASFTNIGGSRKMLLWRNVDDVGVREALSEIQKGETVNVTLATEGEYHFVAGLKLSDGTIVGEYGGAFVEN